MHRFDRNAPTKKVDISSTGERQFGRVATVRRDFGRQETSSITVDSEAIVESRSARPPLPPRTSASLGQPKSLPKAAILKRPAIQRG